jgi:hypothetical protein
MGDLRIMFLNFKEKIKLKNHLMKSKHRVLRKGMEHQFLHLIIIQTISAAITPVSIMHIRFLYHGAFNNKLVCLPLENTTLGQQNLLQL